VGLISPTLPVIGQQRGDGEAAVRSDLVTLLTEFNGNIDSANIKDGSIQPGDLASGTIKVKPYPASIVATAETRTNTAYGLLTTPDRVQNVVLPSNGLLVIGFQAVWQESVNAAARAAIFIGANQLKFASPDTAAPIVAETSLTAGASASIDKALATGPFGLVCRPAGATVFGGNVTTGQVLGVTPTDASVASQTAAGAFCVVFAAAGTYDISVQFKSTSGNVIVKNRQLWVATMDFS
jgi:hypothetical protein